jgi:hypothetical protein
MRHCALPEEQPELSRVTRAVLEITGASAGDAGRSERNPRGHFYRWTQRQQFLIQDTGAIHGGFVHISPRPLDGVEWNPVKKRQ